MEFLDILGRGLCHMDPARSLDGAWLCSRCTGLFAGGLLGVVHAMGMYRRLPLLRQIGVVAVLMLPMAVDTLVLGRGSPVDLNVVRSITGLLAGVGSGLLYGARGLPRVRLDPGSVFLRWAPVAAWGTLILGITLWSVAGITFFLDLAVLIGLLLLCGTATAWGIGGACWLWARWNHRPFERVKRIRLVVLAVMVAVELAVVTWLPNVYKPNLHWISWIWVQG